MRRASPSKAYESVSCAARRSSGVVAPQKRGRERRTYQFERSSTSSRRATAAGRGSNESSEAVTAARVPSSRESAHRSSKEPTRGRRSAGGSRSARAFSRWNTTRLATVPSVRPAAFWIVGSPTRIGSAKSTERNVHRTGSAPSRSRSGIGSRTFPFDFDIFRPVSSRTIPVVSEERYAGRSKRGREHEHRVEPPAGLVEPFRHVIERSAGVKRARLERIVVLRERG